jgi:DNA-binding NarL/FixJ family response regulator
VASRAADGGQVLERDALLLSAEERELLRLLSEGTSADVIGRRLGLSDRTVRRRLRSVCDRVGVDSPIEAVVWAVRHRQI